jgi:glutamyl-tRNA reductase
MSRIAVQHLINKNIKEVYVTNRTRRRVEDFAKEFPQIIQVDLKDRYDLLDKVDILISCTSAPHHMILKDKFLEKYENQPLCILDLAIPRDVDPEINEIESVELYRVDDLEKIAQENIDKRLKAKEKGEKILCHDVKKYMCWIEESKLIEVIVSLQESSKLIMTAELENLKLKLEGLDENQMRIIEKAFCNFARSLTYQPVVQLKEFIKDNPKFNDPTIMNMKEDIE